MTDGNARINYFIVILQKKGKAMLGINSPRELVKGLFAQNVRDSLHRATTGNLTASEKKHARISKMQVVNGILFGNIAVR